MPIVRTARLLIAALALLGASATSTFAAAGDCGQPQSTGTKPSASDALAVLKMAVGAASACGGDLCVCDVNGDGQVTAPDALLTLRVAVGQNAQLRCAASCNIEKPELVTTGVGVDLSILGEYGIATNGLTVTTLLSIDTLAQDDWIAQVQFAAANSGQLLFVGGFDTALMLSYFRSSEIASGSVTVTLATIARGFVMAHPLLLGYSAADRSQILESAEADPLFEVLQEEIGAALHTSPQDLLQDAVFPQLFELALELIINAAELAAQNAAPNAARRATLAAATPVVGTAGAPYLAEAPGAAILAVDPTMLFYGLEITGQPPRLLAGRDSVVELGFWPPVSFSEPVTESITLGDGSFNVQFSKWGIEDKAARMAGTANFLRFGCNVLDAAMGCPASNSLIEQVVEGPELATLYTAAADVFDDLLGINTPDKLLRRMVDVYEVDAVWNTMIKALFVYTGDTAGTVGFVFDYAEFAKSATKYLLLYDAANTYIPFAWDLITKPRYLDFCISQTSGTLSGTCAATPPVAVLVKTSPSTIHVGDTVTFDASQSSDAQTNAEALEVRWDLDGDGSFDTDWSLSRQALYAYPEAGIYTVTLEVRDPGGLVGSAVYHAAVDVAAANSLVSGKDRFGAISEQDEIDVWTFTAEAGDAIVLRINEITASSIGFSPRIELFAPDNTLVDTDEGSRVAEINEVLSMTGTFSVQVSDGIARNDTGTYRLQLVKMPGIPAASEDGGPIANGENHHGTTDVGDLDVWTFSANAGDSIILRVADEAGSPNDLYPSIRLYAPDGELLDTDYGSVGAQISEELPASGTFTVIVTDNSLGLDGTGDYVLRLAKVPGSFVVADDGGPLTNGGNHEGTTDLGDLDMWTFSANAGDNISLRISDESSTGGYYPMILLYAPDGELLDADYSSAAAGLGGELPASGTFTVIVADNSLGLDGIGDYVLRLAKIPGSFVVADEGGPLVIGFEHEGTIEVADIDMWSFTAGAGAQVTLTLTELDDFDGFYPRIRLYAPDGELLRSAYGSEGATIDETLSSAGTYTVLIVDGSLGLDATGTYALMLESD